MHHTASNNQSSINLENHISNYLNEDQALPSSYLTVINNQDISGIKTIQRRKKGLGHRRNNSKGSATSWAPPSLSAIADQEQKRASLNLTPKTIEKIFPINSKISPSNEMVPMKSIKSLVPSISADIDSKSDTNRRQLNPENLKLDLQNTTDSQTSPTSRSRPTTIFTYATRISSSSDPEDCKHHNLSRQRQRRRTNLNINNNNKISSPSSITIHSIKSSSTDQQTFQADETENINNTNDDNNEDLNDLRRYPKTVSFQLSQSTTNDRSPFYQQRKVFPRVNFRIFMLSNIDVDHIGCFSFSVHLVVHLKKAKLMIFQVIIMCLMMRNIELNIMI